MSAAEALARTGHALWHLALQGTTTSFRWFEWMREPSVGDVVFVLHTHANHPPVDRVGRLVAAERRPMPDWDEDVDGPTPTRMVYDVERFDGLGVISWENVDVVRLPDVPYWEIDEGQS